MVAAALNSRLTRYAQSTGGRIVAFREGRFVFALWAQLYLKTAIEIRAINSQRAILFEGQRPSPSFRDWLPVLVSTCFNSSEIGSRIALRCVVECPAEVAERAQFFYDLPYLEAGSGHCCLQILG